MTKRQFALLVVMVCALVQAPITKAGNSSHKAVSDDLLYDNVKRKLATDVDVKGGALEVEVKDGAVVLRGKVDSEKRKSKAEKLVHKVSGVKTVTNEIQVEVK